MKRFLLPLLSVALLAACNQTTKPAEQPTSATPEQTATDTVAADATATTPAGPATAAPTAAAPAVADVHLSLRFKPVADAQPKRTQAFLKLQGPETKEIDLGSFPGKPDLIDAAKAQRAGYPAGWVVGFRSYDAASGTGADVAVLPGTDATHVRIMQRRIDEAATEPYTFQVSRELSLPSPSNLSAAK
ncbi:lipoprotein [Hymenobacter sp. BT730]|uniref:lipoprotein n=1 Tax=Hymenobacter sp. BT730 TaxID=3063332 RepID=UPI0026DFDEEA|nr:lipoprotein [Hymenobacter sp. BT730]